MYRFLGTDCRAYLPDYSVVTVWHLRDICAGKRTMIKCDDVKMIQLPSYDGLTIEDFLEFAEDAEGGKALRALPESKKELMKMPRSYIANVIYTIVGEDFRDWINKKMDERTKRLAEERDMNIKMDPEIYKIFKNSESISSKYIYST